MALMEVCIAARTFGPNRAQEGDIIVIREPRGEVGTKEQADFIWFTVDSSLLPSRNDLRGATQKFKYNISLDSLGIDKARANDPADKYQPFVTVGARGRITATARQALTVTNKEVR